MSAPTYYKLPRISRTPSPPTEYLRRRQEMGGASLPPMPEDESISIEQHSPNDTPDPEVLRPKKKRRAVGTLRVKQRVKNGPVGWDRILSDVEDDGEILESITVKGAVLNAHLIAARDPAIKNKVVSQKIRSRRQSLTGTPIGEATTTGVGGTLEAQGGTQIEAQVQVFPELEPVVMAAQSSTTYAPPTPLPSLTPTHTPVITPAKKKSVKYVRPYQAPVQASPQLAFWSTSTSEGGAQAENQEAPITPPPPTITAPAATPDKQLQEEQRKAMGLDEPVNLSSNIAHSDTSTSGDPNDTQISPSPESAPTTVNGSPTTSVSELVQPPAANEIEVSPGPADFVFHISRTSAETNAPLTERPFRVYGRDFIKSGRWMWQQLITTIKDRTHFDPTQDEILLNWVIPLANIEMLKDQGKEMKRLLENEIIVVRTTREGYWPEWIYERVKERRRVWKRQRERERQERERREAEERERREAEERAARATSQDTIDAPLEDDDGMIHSGAEVTAQDEEMLDSVTVQQEVTAPLSDLAENGEGSSKMGLSKQMEREDIVISKVRGTPVGRMDADTPPPLEDEAIAPEITESQGTIDISVDRSVDTQRKVVVPASFTPVNKKNSPENPAFTAQHLYSTSSIPSASRSTLSTGATAVTSAQSVQLQIVSMPTTPDSASVSTSASAPSQIAVTKEIPASNISPSPRPLPQFNGRPIPMPPAYNRPTNIPSRSTLGSVQPVTNAAIKNAPFPSPTQTVALSAATSAVPAVTMFTASSAIPAIPAIPKASVATASRISNGVTRQQVMINTNPPTTVATATTVTANNIPSTISSLKPRAGSVELPAAVAAATKTPLAKWLAKQGGPTVLPKAVAKAVKENSSNFTFKKLGRPSRRPMPVTTGWQTSPKEQEAVIRPRPGPPGAVQQTLMVSQQQPLVLPSLNAPPSGSSSALSSYPASNVSATSSTVSSYPTRSVPAFATNIAPIPPPNATPVNPRIHAPPTLSSTATSSAVSPAPSTSSEARISVPVATSAFPITPSAVQITTSAVKTTSSAVKTTSSATQTPRRASNRQIYNGESDSDLDLNLDLHLAPRREKETRVPSWIKSKTPVTKGRLSLTGKLGEFVSPSTNIPPTPATTRALRTFGGSGRATWGGEMPRLDSPEVQKRRNELMATDGHSAMDDDDLDSDDEMDNGLDLQRGIKRSRDSLSMNLSPGGLNGKSKSNSFDLMGFTGAMGKGRLMSGGRSRMEMKSKSKSKRVRREEENGEDDDGEGFLSWEVEGKGADVGVKGKVEDEEDLDLGF